MALHVATAWEKKAATRAEPEVHCAVKSFGPATKHDPTIMIAWLPRWPHCNAMTLYDTDPTGCHA